MSRVGYTTVDVKLAVHKKLKARAKREKKTLTALANELLKESLA